MSLDLGNVMTSTPNSKAVNGKAESSDSGAESEEEEGHEEEEEEKEIQQSEKGVVSCPELLYLFQHKGLYCSPKWL